MFVFGKDYKRIRLFVRHMMPDIYHLYCPRREVDILAASIDSVSEQMRREWQQSSVQLGLI